MSKNPTKVRRLKKKTTMAVDIYFINAYSYPPKDHNIFK